ncbi:MAG TPA: histidine phosphatase family protein [Candidatus Limnocylindria bacterium]|jgi:phosphohistidine phosphatase SixA|nr:histidine phosphatase family protein [Candidatus Limnocylindria bacterium]
MVLTVGLAMMASLGVVAQPERIILIRHGEKPADHDDPHLTAEGRAHAERWVAYFTNSPVRLPGVLYAPRPTKQHPSDRASETLQPLAKARQLEIRTPYASTDYAKLAHDLLADDKLKGQTVVICWVHQYLPQFAKALGVDSQPKEWRGEDYDGVYEITFPDGKARLKESTAAK